MQKKMFLVLIWVFFLSCSSYKDFRFAQFSDTHVSESTTGAEDLGLAVADVNRQKGLAFVIVSGDITDMNTSNNLRQAKQILDSLTIPYYIIPGNHDVKWSGSGGENFVKLWGSDHFVFEYNGYRFIGMQQGPILRMGDGHVPIEDLTWLKNEFDILPHQEMPVILISHYGLNSSVDNWYTWADILRSFNLKLMIHGHHHINRQTEYLGVPAIMGRSTLRAGKPLGGYNIYEFRDDSVFVREKKPGKPVGSVWAKTSLLNNESLQAVPDSLMPDYSINEAFANVKEIWQFDAAHTMTASPVLHGDKILVGDRSGAFYCLEVGDGSQKWLYQAKGPILGTAAVSNGYVVFGSLDSSLYCLDLNDGSLHWKVKTDDAIVSVPAINLDIVYCGGSDGVFRAIDINSGQIVWEHKGISAYMEDKPLLYEGKVIFGAWNDTLYALNQLDGNVAWKWHDGRPGALYSPAACWPVGTKGKIFVAAPDRVVSAIDIENGKTIWRNGQWKFRETIGTNLDGSIVYARSMTDSVVAFLADADTPKIQWAVDFGYGYDIAPSQPMEKNGTLFWGTKNGLIIAADAQTGELKWKHKFENFVINTVAPVDDKTVVFSNVDGKVALLHTE